MSKKVLAVLLMVLLAVLTACSGGQGSQGAVSTGAGVPSTDVPEGPPVDIDLSEMSGTMVYAKLFDMLVQPENYYEQTIKIKGSYGIYYIEELDRYLHTVMVADAAECCEQGVEFIWVGEHTYPDDYPERGTMIEVTGVYKYYLEEKSPVYYIETEDITVL